MPAIRETDVAVGSSPLSLSVRLAVSIPAVVARRFLAAVKRAPIRFRSLISFSRAGQVKAAAIGLSESAPRFLARCIPFLSV